jgi:hypothetical protein
VNRCGVHDCVVQIDAGGYRPSPSAPVDDDALRAAITSAVGAWLFSIFWLASALFCWAAFDLPGDRFDWSTIYVTGLAVLLLATGLGSSIVTAVMASRLVPRRVAVAAAALPVVAIGWLAVGVV